MAVGLEHAVETLAAEIAGLGTGHLQVVTGAGISLASGIPTFRGSDPGAVWKRDVTELGTYRFFREDPVGSWTWYLERFSQVLEARPNPAHHALVALEAWHRDRDGAFLLVTQNVDPLHERAGSEALVKVHGSADRVRCPRDVCRNGAPRGSLARTDADLEAFLAEPSEETLPRCPECGEVLRQHVLWFDEYYNEHDDYQWSRVQASAERMDLLMFVGTSMAVGVTQLFLEAGIRKRIPILSIDPGAAPPPHPSVTVLPAKAEEVLPAVVARLADDGG